MTGDQLRKLRLAVGLSIDEAAKQVEVSKRTWFRWESGETPIPKGSLKLFRILNKLENR